MQNILNYATYAVVSIFTIIVFITFALFTYKRHRSPLNARVYSISAYFATFTLLDVFIITFLLQEDGFSADLSRPAIFYFAIVYQWLQIPFYFNYFLWSSVRLYFIYQISASKVEIEISAKKLGNKDDTASFSAAENNFYLRRRHYASNSFITKSFYITSGIEIVCLATYGYFSRYYFKAASTPIFVAIVIIHVLALFAIAIKLRKVRDALYLKTELAICGVLWIIAVILLITSSFWIGLSNLYIVLLGQIVTYFVVIVFPLVMTRKKRRNSNEMKIAPKHAFRSLREIFNDEELKSAFKDFCMKSFNVETFFFLEKLEEFKQDKKLQVGRAVIMFQKFIKPGAFMDLQLPKRVYAAIEEICTDEKKAMKEGAITGTFFASVENWVESKLEEQIEIFRQSPAFLSIIRRRKEEERLEIGLYSIGVVDNTEEK